MKPSKLNLGRRPKCINCKTDAQFVGSYRKDGSAIFRKYCANCHFERLAKKNGYNTTSQFMASLHPYKRFRKIYCENAKGENVGWLGFVCATKIVAPFLQLDTDHIDGNPFNNDEGNLMTLCKCCHAVKTNMFSDYKSPGRKNRKSIRLSN